MNKKWLLVLGFLILVGLCIGSFFLSNEKNLNDAEKFKEEYEALNNTVRESDGASYNNVEISSDNPIQYITGEEAVDILENKTGLIYFGAPWCPWCRNAVPVLLETAELLGLGTIYYVDADTIRNTWKIENNTLVKTKQEGKGYYDILKILDPILGEETYQLKDSSGTTYDTKEKRLYIPIFVAVKNGEIKSTHVGTVDLNENQTKYDALTEGQKEELITIFKNMIELIQDTNTCTLESKC